VERCLDLRRLAGWLAGFYLFHLRLGLCLVERRYFLRLYKLFWYDSRLRKLSLLVLEGRLIAGRPGPLKYMRIPAFTRYLDLFDYSIDRSF
jgi:hypothetical protein